MYFQWIIWSYSLFCATSTVLSCFIVLQYCIRTDVAQNWILVFIGRYCLWPLLVGYLNGDFLFLSVSVSLYVSFSVSLIFWHFLTFQHTLQSRSIFFLLQSWNQPLFQWALDPFMGTLARTSSTMWNRTSERRHPSLAPKLNRKISISPLSMMLNLKYFIDTFYQVRQFKFLFLGCYKFFVCSIKNGCWIFVKWFFCIYWESHMFFIHSCFNVVNYTDFWKLKQGNLKLLSIVPYFPLISQQIAV